jgi:hypothetical protein
VTLAGFPAFSPDGHRFVDAALDIDAGFMPNSISIYKVDEHGMQPEAVFPMGKTGPGKPVWLNSAALVFFETGYVKEQNRDVIARKPCLLEWENGKWRAPVPLHK